ncbi:MAG: hypothetical protein JWM28_4169 [Chitinophagaceae bacterium]|nr:hypothetical protein [Chitinophagaceae bacterium]
MIGMLLNVVPACIQWLKTCCIKTQPAATALLFILLFPVSNPLMAQTKEYSAGDHFWLWSFLGRLHPMIVHFPISLLFVALLLEMIDWRRKSGNFRPAIRILVLVGALSAVTAVIFGLLLSSTDEYEISDALSVHQWTGIATMAAGCLTAHAYWKFSPRIQKALLILTVAGVTIAGHYGATLTHGEDYLSSVLPSHSSTAGIDSSFILASNKGGLNEEQVQELNLQVRAIFAHNCTNCHGAAKVKGELRLDKREFILKGGEDGAVIIPGKPDESDLIRRIKLPRSHKEAMPAKGKALTKEEIALLEFWIKQGAPWPKGELKSLYHVAAMAPHLPELPPVSGDLVNPVDRFVNVYFQKNKVKWNKPVDDRTYMRRVYLDITGLLPPPDSLDAFINNTTIGKRESLVRELLGRNDDYAQHWLTFWNDALRNDYSGTGYITQGRFGITKWLYNSLRDNKPYDLFVKELISPDKESKGFITGIQWRGTINASQRTEMQAAQNISQVFLGLNLKCASCHDSFISDWKLDDSYAFANIFSDTVLEINRCDKPTGRMAGRRILFKELGQLDSNANKKNRLRQLADILVQPKDGRLFRTLVNRVWAQLMGRGMVEPVDVMDNQPWSQDLLDWMASDFTANGYDIKKLLYTILTSKTYQLPSVGIKDAGLIVAQDYTFKGMLRRRLTAEEFTDAVSMAIEPIYPDSIVVYNLLPDSIKNVIPFARASLVKNDPFLTALGRPNRETVSTSRTSQANLLQALELTNGIQFNNALKRGAGKWKEKYPDAGIMIKEIYRKALGRLPLGEEQAVAMKTLGNNPSEAAIQDFIWAITLHPEFQLIF